MDNGHILATTLALTKHTPQSPQLLACLLCSLIPSLHSASVLVLLLSLIFLRNFPRELGPKLFSNGHSAISAMEMVDVGKDATWSHLTPFTRL